LLGVSACGSSSPKTMTPAATAFLLSAAESGGASAAQATQVVDCLDPAFQAHGITTLSATKSINADTQSNEPAWLSAAGTKCEQQIIGSSIASGSSGPG
jgi:3-polyprenyl-4-hydroxybenzoate decarboxylase